MPLIKRRWHTYNVFLENFSFPSFLINSNFFAQMIIFHFVLHLKSWNKQVIQKVSLPNYEHPSSFFTLIKKSKQDQFILKNVSSTTSNFYNFEESTDLKICKSLLDHSYWYKTIQFLKPHKSSISGLASPPCTRT